MQVRIPLLTKSAILNKMENNAETRDYGEP